MCIQSTNTYYNVTIPKIDNIVIGIYTLIAVIETGLNDKIDYKIPRCCTYRNNLGIICFAFDADSREQQEIQRILGDKTLKSKIENINKCIIINNASFDTISIFDETEQVVECL